MLLSHPARAQQKAADIAWEENKSGTKSCRACVHGCDWSRSKDPYRPMGACDWCSPARAGNVVARKGIVTSTREIGNFDGG